MPIAKLKCTKGLIHTPHKSKTKEDEEKQTWKEIPEVT